MKTTSEAHIDALLALCGVITLTMLAGYLMYWAMLDYAVRSAL